MSEGNSGEVQRWTAKRRAALVVSSMKGETSVAEAARQRRLKVSEIEDRQETCLLAAAPALRSRPSCSVCKRLRAWGADTHGQRVFP